MRTLFLILLFISADRTYSQNLPLDRYYLSDFQKKKNRVKTSIDTSIRFPDLNSISEYDEEGREIVWYYTRSNTKNYSKFLYNQDTLVQIRFTSTNDTIKSPFEIRKYVYNKKGNISFYAACRRSPRGDKNEANFVRFYYEKTGELTSALYYSNYNYPFVINQNFPVTDSLFKLTNVESFQYNKNLQLIARKQMIGYKEERYVDTFEYDNQKRLVKQVRHQKEGFVGDMRKSNIFYITEYAYSDSSVLEKQANQYDDVFGKTNRYYEREYETVKQKNGLISRIYLKMNDKKDLLSTYEYRYY